MRKILFKVRKLIILILFLSAAYVVAEDMTPYNLVIIRDGGTVRHATITWIAERADLLTHFGSSGGAAFFDSIMDTADAMAKTVYGGPYCSNQEIYKLGWVGENYDANVLEAVRDTQSGNWLAILVEHYLDSIGQSIELAYLHIRDSAYSIWNSGRGDRGVRHIDWADTASETAILRNRFFYQQMNNTPSSCPTYYPIGMVWLANGSNQYVKEAVAYAFRRRFTEDRAWIDGAELRYWSYGYGDNQYANYFMPLLNSYYSIHFYHDTGVYLTSSIYCDGACDSSFHPLGGPTDSLDFFETPPEFWSTSNALNYFMQSTVKLDSAVQDILDSVYTILGKEFKYIVNVNWANSGDACRPLPEAAGIFLEGPTQPDRGAGLWSTLFTIADSLALVYTNSLSIWYLPEHMTSYGLTAERCARTTYGLYLTVNTDGRMYYLSGGEMVDSTNFWGMYYIDFGTPDLDTAQLIYTQGSSWGDWSWTWRRDYNGGQNVMLFRSSNSSVYDYNDDSIAINVHGLYSEISADGDTSETVDSIFYILPYEGLLLTAGEAAEAPPNITNILPDSAWVDTLVAWQFSFTDAHGVDSAWLYLWPPDSVPGVNDSISLVDTLYDPIKTSGSPSKEYAPADSGDYWIVACVTDTNDHMVCDSELILVDIPQPPGPSDSIIIPINFTTFFSTNSNGVDTGHCGSNPMRHGYYYGSWRNLYLVDIDSLKAAYAAVSGNIDSAYYTYRATGQYLMNDSTCQNEITTHKILVSWDTLYTTRTLRGSGTSWNVAGMGSGSDYEAASIGNAYYIYDAGYDACTETILEYDNLPCQINIHVGTGHIDSICNDSDPYGIVSVPVNIVGSNSFRINMAGAGNATPPTLVLWVPSGEEPPEPPPAIMMVRKKKTGE